MITALADERATGHLKYPDLRFPARWGYLFQTASLKYEKIFEMIRRQAGFRIRIFSRVVILRESEY